MLRGRHSEKQSKTQCPLAREVDLDLQAKVREQPDSPGGHGSVHFAFPFQNGTLKFVRLFVFRSIVRSQENLFDGTEFCERIDWVDAINFVPTRQNRSSPLIVSCSGMRSCLVWQPHNVATSCLPKKTTFCFGTTWCFISELFNFTKEIKSILELGLANTRGWNSSK